MPRTDPSTSELDLRAIARRAAGRALAERGSRPRASGPGSPSAQLLGVHVAVTPPAGSETAGAAGAAPGESRPHGAGGRPGRALVDAESLRQVADGAEFPVPPGALVTELAQEEARRRGIRLVAFPGSAGARRTRRVALGADHGGFKLKREILGWLGDFDAVGVDLGTRDENPCDYPDFARAVALAVARGEVDFGILVDGAGIGSAMAANKVPGVRAANCVDVAMARNAREHNFANVLTLGASLPRNTVHQVIHAFLSTDTGADRHRKRVQKITDIERLFAPRKPTP